MPKLLADCPGCGGPVYDIEGQTSCSHCAAPLPEWFGRIIPEPSKPRLLTYNIRITNPAPSMSQDRIVFQAATYGEAVQVAHEAFLRHRRPVTLGSGEYGMDNWHRVDSDGVTTDRCINGGVPTTQRLV